MIPNNILYNYLPSYSEMPFLASDSSIPLIINCKFKKTIKYGENMNFPNKNYKS